MTALGALNSNTLSIPAARPAGADLGIANFKSGSAFERLLGRDQALFSSEAQAVAEKEDPAATNAGPKDSTQLDPQEKQEVAKLKSRDTEVRTHEQAHLSALAGQGGSANFEYTTGPDGRRYATGGEVPITIGEAAGGPRETIRNAQTIARAAVAPAQPSSADQAARARAQQVEAQARQELREKDESDGDEDSAETAPADSAAVSASGLIDAATIKPNSGSDTDSDSEDDSDSEEESHDEADEIENDDDSGESEDNEPSDDHSDS